MSIRLTSARQAILDQLEHEKTHLTAIQIHDKLQVRLPSLNLSTVYRSLDYLVENRLVSVSDMGLGSPVYELVSDENHHHLVCLSCQSILHLEPELVSPFFEKVQQLKGFNVRTNHLVLFGYCQACSKT